MSPVARHLRAAASALALVVAAGGLQAAALLLGPAAPHLNLWLGLPALAALAAAAALGVRCWLELRGDAAQARRDEARQRSIVDGAGEAIIVIDDQATIHTFNRAAERMFGYAAPEMIGTSLERLMTSGARRAHASYLAENGVTAMVEAARLRTVHKGVRKRGDVFTFELTMTEWFDGQRRMFTGVMRDITEHERAASAMREREAYFAAVYDNVTNPLFIFALAGDGGFALESINRSAEDLIGSSRFAAAGATPEELSPADGRRLKRAMFDCLSGAEVITQDIRLASDAGDRHIRLALSPMRNGSGEIRGVLASGRIRNEGASPAAASQQVPADT